MNAPRQPDAGRTAGSQWAMAGPVRRGPGRILAAVLVLCLVCGPAAWAQDPAQDRENQPSLTFPAAAPTHAEQNLAPQRDAPPTSPGRLSSGGFKVIPRLELDVAADSNIHSAKDGESDIYTVYGAGFTAGYEDFLGRKKYPDLRRLYFLTSLDVDRQSYLEHAEFDNTNWLATVEGGFQTPGGWSASFRDRLNATARSSGADNDYGLGVPGLNRLGNLFEGRAEYEFVDRWSAEVGLRHNYLDYAAFSSSWQNRDDLEGWSALLWRFLPRTQALVELRRKRVFFPDQQDARENSMGLDDATSIDSVSTALFTGVRFAPLARVQGEAKVGVMRKDFDNDATREDLPLDDARRWAMEANLSWKMTEVDAVTFLASRTINETSDLLYQYREETGARLRLWRDLTHNLKAEASAGFYHYDYQPLGTADEREDDMLKGLVGLRYLVRSWSSVGFYYACDKRYSSMPEEEYVKHLFELRLGLEY